MLPKTTSAKVDDPDNPAWTEGMLGAPMLRRGSNEQTVAQDSARDIWQETLDAVRDIKAGRVGAIRQVPTLPIAKKR